jgi:hypothetical protein
LALSTTAMTNERNDEPLVCVSAQKTTVEYIGA